MKTAPSFTTEDTIIALYCSIDDALNSVGVSEIHGKLGAVLSAINPVGRALFVSEDLEKLSWKAFLLGLVLADATGRPSHSAPRRRGRRRAHA